LNNDEILQVQAYLRKKFRLDTLALHKRPNKDDSVEVMIGDEFIGIIYKDDEDGEVSYDFNMAILEFDLTDEE
jgi:predicted RNA-binding protein (virulence factor B family)